jgi:hypothetical protein
MFYILSPYRKDISISWEKARAGMSAREGRLAKTPATAGTLAKAMTPA